MLVSLQGNASLIKLTADHASYEVGDTVLVDISMEGLSLDTAELGFSLEFDSTAISFDFFDFSNDVVNSAWFTAADLSFSDNNLIDFFVIWWDSSDLPATSFSFGQASFTAQQAYNTDFDVKKSYSADVYGTDLDNPSFSVSVTEPTTSLIMLFGLLLLPLQKKLSTKR